MDPAAGFTIDLSAKSSLFVDMGVGDGAVLEEPGLAFVRPDARGVYTSEFWTAKQVLFVEDDQISRMCTERLLSGEFGMKVLSAEGTEAALTHVDTIGHENLSLVVTDCDYGDYGKARQLLGALQEMKYEGPIIMLAGQNFAERPALLNEMGSLGVLAAIEKPTRSTVIEAVLSVLVRTSESAEEEGDDSVTSRCTELEVIPNSEEEEFNAFED